jgi:hypothetical protein
MYKLVRAERGSYPPVAGPIDARRVPMEIPDISNKIWTDIVTGRLSMTFDLLAIKILLARLKLNVQLDPEGTLVEQSARELRELFVRCGHLPNARKDLIKIIESGEA